MLASRWIRIAHRASALFVAAVLAACGGNGSETTSGPRGGGGGAPVGSGEGGGLLFTTGVGSSSSTGSGASIPASFVPADIGGYARGAAITADGVSDTGVESGDGCAVLVGVARDFRGRDEAGGHPDFEAFQGDQPTKGLVKDALGSDGKPIFAGHCDALGAPGCSYGQQLTTKARFDEWYRKGEGVNQPYLVYLQFVEDPATHVATFASSLFFPLDGAGFGDSGTGTDNKPHNFGFTTEIHTQFKYSGGERFTFTGDDDLWVFINQKLAIDLGGLHPPASASVDLDQAAATLGIEPGKVYSLDLFHAERHTEGSNFRVDTNLGFVDCGSVPAEVK